MDQNKDGIVYSRLQKITYEQVDYILKHRLDGYNEIIKLHIIGLLNDIPIEKLQELFNIKIIDPRIVDPFSIDDLDYRTSLMHTHHIEIQSSIKI